MTPAALVDLYSGEIVTHSSDHCAARDALAKLKVAELRQVAALAPGTRLARLAAVEIEKRADDRARRRIARAMAAAVTMRPRTERWEEGAF